MSLRQAASKIVYWLAWPLLFFYMRLGKRSRVLIVHGDKILLVKNWFGEGKWSLPGGGIHKNEDARFGAIREVLEETGVKLEPAKLSFLKKGSATKNGLTYNYVAYYAQMDTLVGIKIQPMEIMAAEWLPLSKIKPDTCAKLTIELVKQWQQGR